MVEPLAKAKGHSSGDRTESSSFQWVGVYILPYQPPTRAQNACVCPLCLVFSRGQYWNEPGDSSGSAQPPPTQAGAPGAPFQLSPGSSATSSYTAGVLVSSPASGMDLGPTLLVGVSWIAALDMSVTGLQPCPLLLLTGPCGPGSSPHPIRALNRPASGWYQQLNLIAPQHYLL